MRKAHWRYPFGDNISGFAPTSRVFSSAVLNSHPLRQWPQLILLSGPQRPLSKLEGRQCLRTMKCDCCNNSEACLTSAHSACPDRNWPRNFFRFFFDFILTFQSLIGVRFTTVF